MITYLTDKLETQAVYTDQELNWLLEHIGDSSATIRDDLVYASFCKAILGERISCEQFKSLAEQVLEQDLLFYQMEQVGTATLTRSFAALLLALLIDCDNQKDSLFYQALSVDQSQAIFSAALLYMEKEQDYRGYDENCGWVHALAHGADLLFFATQHQAFPREKTEAIWLKLLDKMAQLPQSFTAGEEVRLARIFSGLVVSGRLSFEELAHWLEVVKLRVSEDRDYFGKLTTYHFLSSLFLQLKGGGTLSDKLEQIFLEKLGSFG